MKIMGTYAFFSEEGGTGMFQTWAFSTKEKYLNAFKASTSSAFSTEAAWKISHFVRNLATYAICIHVVL